MRNQDFREIFIEPVENKCRLTIGPPGTGKTTWLGEQATLAAKTYGSAFVLVASLTRTAAAEVVRRKLPLGKDHIGTLHSHAYHALGCPEIVTTEHLTDWNSGPGATKNMELTSVDCDVDDLREEDSKAKNGDRLLRAYQTLRSQLVPEETWPPAAREFSTTWGAWKHANDLMDFEDLIQHALRDVATAPGNPAAIFLDEVQDHSQSELALALSWARNAQQITLVGDPDQALYTWRGADPGVLTSTIRDIQVLRRSWRVSRAVHAVADRWIRRLEGRYAAEYEPRNFEGSTEKALLSLLGPKHLIEDAMRRLDAGKRVMLLASCQYMLDGLVHTLREEGIPFHNPYRAKNGAWNPMRSVGRVLDYLRPDEATWGPEARPWTWAEVWRWLKLIDAQHLIHGTKEEVRKLAKEEFQPLLAPTAKEAFESVDECFKSGVKWWNDGDPWRLSNLVLKSKSEGLEYPCRVAEKRGPWKLREEPRLIVGTIHSVKGGEADVVYVFPDCSPEAKAQWRMDGARSMRRMFYVAFTRAREDLVLCQLGGGELFPTYWHEVGV